MFSLHLQNKTDLRWIWQNWQKSLRPCDLSKFIRNAQGVARLHVHYCKFFLLFCRRALQELDDYYKYKFCWSVLNMHDVQVGAAVRPNSTTATSARQLPRGLVFSLSATSSRRLELVSDFQPSEPTRTNTSTCQDASSWSVYSVQWNLTTCKTRWFDELPCACRRPIVVQSECVSITSSADVRVVLVARARVKMAEWQLLIDFQSQ